MPSSSRPFISDASRCPARRPDSLFVPLQQWLTAPIHDALSQTVVSYEWAPPQVRFSGMNGDAPVRGAAYQAQDALLREIPLL